MNIAHRKVALNTSGDRLEFDYSQGRYRVALYEPQRSGERIVGEKRTAAMHPQLGQALTIVLGEADSDHDPVMVEYYMRHQAWGKELP